MADFGGDTADYGPSDSGPSSFGGGLSFRGTAATTPMDARAEMPADTAIGAPSNDTPVQPQPAFGQGLRNVLPGPHYTAPDPATSALDQTADTLGQRIKRANEVATNPMLQFFNPEGAKAARDFVPAATEQLQKIRQQQAGMAANRQQAATLGLAPGEVPDEASLADRVEVAKSKALQGNLSVFKGLQLVDPKTAETIQDQVAEKAGVHLTNAQLAFDSLSGMQNEGQYQAKLSQLRKEGTLTDLEALGLKVPPSFDGFNAVKGTEGKSLRDARMAVDTIRNKLEQRTTAQPMEKAEAETYKSAWKTVYGDAIEGQSSRIASTGARGLIIDGYDDPRKLGKGTVLATPDQRKSIKEDAELAVPKEDLEKFRANNRTYRLATTGPDGKPLPADQINTNPNVQQGIAEGLASALRGGQGGANVGLLKIETSKRGYIQGLLDSITSNYAGAIDTISEKTVKPYLTKLTQTQQRDVLDFLHQYNAGDIPDRLATTAKRAGALGLDAAALGFGTKEAAGAVNDAVEEGRQAQVALDMTRHQVAGTGRGFLSYGALNPSGAPTSTPPGTGPTTQLPGPGNQTPVQQAQQPVPPTGPVSPQGRPSAAAAPGPGGGPAPVTPGGGLPGPGGAPMPVTIGGKQVSAPMPPGASPDYVARMQKIESGGEKNPWTSGTPTSSASGAFQFINSTWAANKPPGAPDRAKDATPEQQTAALAKLTASNGQALAAAKLPVNDTTLYMAHNVGAGGATSLLSASPTEDARSIVGKQAADNNPKFFKGKPTVATVLDRYNAAMNEAPDEGPKPRPGAGGATAEQPPTFMQRARNWMSAGAAPEGNPNPSDASLSPEQRAEATRAAASAAPAAMSTAGAVAGSVAGPAGTIAGGAAGGGAGQSFKDWMQGRDQNATQIAKQAALGGVLGVASAGRPLVAAAARVGGSAAVEGGAAAAEGGDAADVADAALKGGGLALGGELLGRFISSLGPAAHKLFSKFTPDAQAELSAQAGKLVEARKVLASEQPTLPGVGGAAGAKNPAFEAAKKTEEDASQFMKDHGQKPDDMAYAYEQTKAGTSSGEAAVLRKANSEKADIGEGYGQIRKDINETGVGVPKPNQAVPDGPLSTIRTTENPTGKVPEAFRADAEHAEMLVKAPAPNGWGEKWQQLQDAGSELIKKRMAFLANNDKPSAEAMNNIFEGVRSQQKAAAEYVFGKEQGAKVIGHLEDLDKRYAKVMNATQGMNYEKMKTTVQGGNTPASRELESNFKEFAKDDPMAVRAFNAMKAGAKGRMGEEAKLMIPVIAGEFAANMGGIPTVGVISAAIGGHRLVSLMKEYMNAKLLGRPVAFKDFATDAVKAYAATHGAMNAAGSAVQRGMVMQ